MKINKSERIAFCFIMKYVHKHFFYLFIFIPSILKLLNLNNKSYSP